MNPNLSFKQFKPPTELSRKAREYPVKREWSKQSVPDKQAAKTTLMRTSGYNALAAAKRTGVTPSSN